MTHVYGMFPFAGRLAGRYRNTGEPAADLEQVARLGLVKAVDRYDSARGSFTAFAVATVTGELKRYFRDSTWGVHVPRRLQDLAHAVKQAENTLTTQLRRRPTDAEVACRAEASIDDVMDARRSAAGYRSVSFSLPVGETGRQLGDQLGETAPAVDLVADQVTLRRLVDRLPECDRRILTERFYGNRTQAEIAAGLGISQMHVSRLLARTLEWLRAAMLGDQVPSWAAQSSEVIETTPLVTVRGDGSGALRVFVAGEIDHDNAHAGAIPSCVASAQSALRPSDGRHHAEVVGRVVARHTGVVSAVRCDIGHIGTRLLVTVIGDLSLWTAPRLRMTLLKCLLEQPDAVVADLTALTVSESQALSVYSAVSRQALAAEPRARIVAVSEVLLPVPGRRAAPAIWSPRPVCGGSCAPDRSGLSGRERAGCQRDGACADHDGSADYAGPPLADHRRAGRVHRGATVGADASGGRGGRAWPDARRLDGPAMGESGRRRWKSRLGDVTHRPRGHKGGPPVAIVRSSRRGRQGVQRDQLTHFLTARFGLFAGLAGKARRRRGRAFGLAAASCAARTTTAISGTVT
jgi:RNA polymerase sigma-70 factor (sigma-B/F/G subfamily)